MDALEILSGTIYSKYPEEHSLVKTSKELWSEIGFFSQLKNMQKKRICLVSMSYWGQLQGGAEYQLHLLASELIQHGYEIFYIFVDQDISVQHEKLKLVPIKINRFNKRVFYPYQSLAFFKLLGKLRDIKPDVIINRRGDALTGSCAYYARRSSCKMIWHVADEPDVTPLKIRWKRTFPLELLNKKLLEYGIRNADCIITQAAYQNVLLKKHYNRSCNAIIRNFHPEPTEVIDKSGVKKIVWIANIKVKKNPDIFLALARKFEAYNNVNFIMIGREGCQKFQNNINTHSATAANFEYRGELCQERVNQLLCESHLFINTSSYEGFPNTFIQSWMRRVPVVSLYVNPDNVLTKNQIGFHSKTFKQLVLDVRNFIENEDLLLEYGARAQKYAFATHSMHQNIGEIVRLIEK